MSSLTWSIAAPAIGSAFLASLVEIVEAFTVVLAAARLRGWRPAALGAAAALALLAVLTVLLGPLLARIPVHVLQFIVGVLLLLFGMSWLRKAILRAAGALPLHDESVAFTTESAALVEASRRQNASLEWLAGLTAFKGCC